MRIKSRKSRIIPEGVALSREELSTVLATVEALERASPNDVGLSDVISFNGTSYETAWIKRTNQLDLNGESASDVEDKLVESLTACTKRRLDARRSGNTIQELPNDFKFLALNKAIHEAEKSGLVLVRDRMVEADATVGSEDPRDVVLVKPKDEPVRVSGHYLVSGSNVIGGPEQLPLFEDAMVEVVYFLRDAPYAQVRATVPLRMAEVRNLSTRIAGEFVRAKPDDRYLTAVAPPDVYVPDGLPPTT